MRIPKSIRWIVTVLGVLAATSIVYYNFILDWEGRPFCHKQVMLGLQTWAQDNETNALPNTGGLSWNSILEFKEEMAGTNWARHYRYIPGLRQDDPGDLVLLYLDQPTRWVWHESPPTIFDKQGWILVPLDFTMLGSRDRTMAGPGECSEWVSGVEFSRRLLRTLDFVRTNERPNWQTIVAEHEKFLKSVERERD